MAETIAVQFVLDDDPTESLVEETLRFCNDGFPADHPYYDDLALSDSEFDDAVADVLDGGLVGFQYGTDGIDRTQAFDYRVGANRTDWVDAPSLDLLVHDAYFRTESSGTDEADARRAASALRGFLVDLYGALGGHERGIRYVLAIDDGDVIEYRDRRPIVTADGLDAGDLPPPVWLQVLSPALADSVGRERLQAAPAWRVEDLDDGSVILVVDELPKLPQAGLETNHEAVTEHFEG